ncbi:uncharacterized protein LOC116731136 isoform X1 [Xiphophorus hellerii]|uniref:uncharacterized protein LOC116731136 isoform X1 n=2 Tax=Xiphophorus hellerii TaxID=8084 RepID=UPI0013B464DA|nr:uncharacterized protein LOC116731136 isoform X1 [Xiphophorus hellerii]XP_032436557.1 uncharacterized protein LOC116731136 isoform X1 [Xiphophorus hellerii]
MDPGGVQKDMLHHLFCKSELLNSLEAYLNNKARLQPIIGLGTIIECVNVTSRVRETLYLCEVCACRLTKADMRNHIMGSHHRFNYIKACHPHSVSKWLGSPDLSKMAWPLMELAKVLEKKEGPGNVQLFEVQDELYQMMVTQSENHAVTLMKTLKQKQAEVESFSETKPLHYPVASQRVVLPARNQWEHPETSDRGDMKLFQVSQQTEQQTPLQNVSAPQLERVQMSAEASVVSESGDGFLEDFPRAKPVIGLIRVVEFRSEDGCSCCFLCHCCRIRSTKNDLIDHLTSSSHLVNYLMEIYPDQIQALGEVSEDDFQLQSLAAKVEEEEGRGEMKIVNVPESICSQLTGKSYHWCLKMLSRGGEHSNLQQKRQAVIGLNKITPRHLPKKGFVAMPEQAKRMKPMKKKRKRTNTMFNVSLPIGEGELLLERRSFDTDHLYESPASPSSKSDVATSPSEVLETKSPIDSPVDIIDIQLELQTSQLEQQLYQEDTDSGDYMSEKHITVTVFQGEDGYVGDNLPGLNKLRGSQECSSKDWTYDDLQAQNGGHFAAGAHSEEFSPFDSYYREGSCGTNIWYSSASAGAEREALRLERESNEIISSYEKQRQNQQPSWSDAGFHTGRVWEQQVPYLKDARINVETHSGDIPVYRGSFLLDPRGQVHETEQRQAQTYTKFTTDYHQTASQLYTPPSTALEFNPIQQRLMFHACYDASSRASQGPLLRTTQGALLRTNPNFMYPVTDGAGWGWTQADAFIQPGQSACYTPSPEVYFSAGIPN